MAWVAASDVEDIGHAALLFSDIEGSTRLARQLGDDWASTLARHREVLRAAFQAEEGTEASREGDSFFVLFPSSDGAVRAALSAQLGLQQVDWPPGGDIRIRVGIHAGDVRRDVEGEHVGLAIHEAARLAAAGHGGQILVTDVVAADLSSAGDFPERVTLKDLGRYRFKDFDQPRQVLQVEHPDLVAEFPPIRAHRAENHNLPPGLLSFFGREHEVDALVGAIPEHRVLTLVGLGGTGKTRLAIEVASTSARRARFPEGVWLVELAEVHEGRDVVGAVGAALGTRAEDATDTGGLGVVTSYLEDRAALLVLDNCEHVLDACAQLAQQIVAECPHVRVLATSRQPLGLAAETVWPVAPLDAPPNDFAGSLADLTRYAAGALFIDRARLVAPGLAHRLTDDDVGAIAKICSDLDGIPLAVEIAAARVAVLSPAQIAARLERTGVLTGLGRDHDRPDRQQTLAAVISWSHALLNLIEQLLFRRLAVFGAPFTLDATEQVVPDEVFPVEEVLGALSALVAKSLLAVDRRDDGVRYHMLETVHEFAQAKLVDSGEEPAMRERHSAWFEALAAEIAGRQPGIARVQCGTTRDGALEVRIVPTAPRDGVGRIPRFMNLLPDADDVAWLAEQLREWRVVGAPLVMSPATYIPVAISVEADLDGRSPYAAVEAAARRAVYRYLDPVHGGERQTGWPFGGRLTSAMIASVVESVFGVRTARAAILPIDPTTHAADTWITAIDLGDSLLFVDSVWLREASAPPLPHVGPYPAGALLDAIRRVLPAMGDDGDLTLSGTTGGIRLSAGTMAWSAVADVEGPRLLEEHDSRSLTASRAVALATVASRAHDVEIGFAFDRMTIDGGATGERADLVCTPAAGPVPSWDTEEVRGPSVSVDPGALLTAVKALGDSSVDGSATISFVPPGVMTVGVVASGGTRHTRDVPGSAEDDVSLDCFVPLVALRGAIEALSGPFRGDLIVDLPDASGGPLFIRSSGARHVRHRLDWWL